MVSLFYNNKIVHYFNQFFVLILITVSCTLIFFPLLSVAAPVCQTGQFSVDNTSCTHEFWFDPHTQIHPLLIQERLRFFIQPLATYTGDTITFLSIVQSQNPPVTFEMQAALSGVTVSVSDFATDLTLKTSGTIVVRPDTLTGITRFVPSLRYSFSNAQSSVYTVAVNVDFILESVPNNLLCTYHESILTPSFCSCDDSSKWGKFCNWNIPILPNSQIFTVSGSNSALDIETTLSLPLTSSFRFGGFRFVLTDTDATFFVKNTITNVYVGNASITTASITTAVSATVFFTSSSAKSYTPQIQLYDDNLNLYQLAPHNLTFLLPIMPPITHTILSSSLFRCNTIGTIGTNCLSTFQINQGIGQGAPLANMPANFNSPINFLISNYDNSFIPSISANCQTQNFSDVLTPQQYITAIHPIHALSGYFIIPPPPNIDVLSYACQFDITFESIAYQSQIEVSFNIQSTRIYPSYLSYTVPFPISNPPILPIPFMTHSVLYPGNYINFNDYFSSDWTITSATSTQTSPQSIPNNIITSTISTDLYALLYKNSPTFYYIYIQQCPSGSSGLGPSCDTTVSITAHLPFIFDQDTISATIVSSYPYNTPSPSLMGTLSLPSIASFKLDPNPSSSKSWTIKQSTSTELANIQIFSPIRLAISVPNILSPISSSVQYFFSTKCTKCTSPCSVVRCYCPGFTYGLSCAITAPTLIVSPPIIAGNPIFMLSPVTTQISIEFDSTLHTNDIYSVRLYQSDGDVGFETDLVNGITATWDVSTFLPSISSGQSKKYMLELVSIPTGTFEIVYFQSTSLLLARPSSLFSLADASNPLNIVSNSYFCSGTYLIGMFCDVEMIHIDTIQSKQTIPTPTHLPVSSTFSIKLPISFVFSTLFLYDSSTLQTQYSCNNPIVQNDANFSYIQLQCKHSTLNTDPASGKYQLYIKFLINGNKAIHMYTGFEFTFVDPLVATTASFAMSTVSPKLLITNIVCLLCPNVSSQDKNIYFSVTAFVSGHSILLPVTVNYPNQANQLINVYEFPFSTTLNPSSIEVDFTQTLIGVTQATFSIASTFTSYNGISQFRSVPTQLLTILPSSSLFKMQCMKNGGSITSISGSCTCSDSNKYGPICQFNVKTQCFLQCPMYMIPDSNCSQCICTTVQCQTYTRTMLVTFTPNPVWPITLYGISGLFQQLSREVESFLALNKYPESVTFPPDLHDLGSIINLQSPSSVGFESITIVPINQKTIASLVNSISPSFLPEISVFVTFTIQPYQIPTSAQFSALQTRFTFVSNILAQLFSKDDTSPNPLVNSSRFLTQFFNVYLSILSPVYQSSFSSHSINIPLLTTKCTRYAASNSSPGYICPQPSFGTSPLWNCQSTTPSSPIPISQQGSLIPTCNFGTSTISNITTKCPFYPDTTQMPCSTLLSPPTSIPSQLAASAQISPDIFPSTIWVGELFPVSWKYNNFDSVQADFSTVAIYLSIENDYDRLLAVSPLSRSLAFVTIPTTTFSSISTNPVITATLKLVLVQKVSIRTQTLTQITLLPSRQCSNVNLVQCITTDSAQIDMGYGCKPETTQCGCNKPFIIDSNNNSPTYQKCISPCHNAANLSSDGKCICSGTGFTGVLCEIPAQCNTATTDLPSMNNTPTSSFCNLRGIDTSSNSLCGSANSCQCFNSFTTASNCKSCGLTDLSTATPLEFQCDVRGTNKRETDKLCTGCICLPGFSGNTCEFRALLVTLAFASNTAPPIPTLPIIQNITLPLSVAFLLTQDLSLSMGLPLSLFSLNFARQNITAQTTTLSVIFSVRSSDYSQIRSPNVVSHRNFFPKEAKDEGELFNSLFEPLDAPPPTDDSVAPSMDDLYGLWNNLQSNHDALPISQSQAQNSTGTAQTPPASFDPNCDPASSATPCPTGQDPYNPFQVQGTDSSSEFQNASMSAGIIAAIVVCIVVGAGGSIAIVFCLGKHKKLCFNQKKRQSKSDSSQSTDLSTLSGSETSIETTNTTLLTNGTTSRMSPTTISSSSATADFIPETLTPGEPELPDGWKKFKHRVTGQIIYINSELMISQTSNPNLPKSKDSIGDNQNKGW